MVKKLDTNRLMRFLTRYKWKLMTNLHLNNTKINRILRPVNDLEMGEINIEISNLCLSESDYKKFVSSDILSKYNKLDYIHTKPLEYLTTLSLLDLKEGDKILDAAGGEEAEYIKAVIAVSDFNLIPYCQDSLLDGITRDGIKYIGGSIDAIPLPDNSLDGISCHHSFEHFRDDLDIKFIKEAVRLLRVGKRLVIAPLFLANEYAEIWNSKQIEKYDIETAITIFDNTATFPGWGPYEGFARTYSPAAFRARIIENLPRNCQAQVYKVLVDGKPVPDLKKNYHQPLLNGEMKALVIVKT
ncbi:class I SAM-dependent methyltransferase [Desmonostoc muscorum]|nr:class I SAM-dependent methyltransferase [Desmonostoc muscorum]